MLNLWMMLELMIIPDQSTFDQLKNSWEAIIGRLRQSGKLISPVYRWTTGGGMTYNDLLAKIQNAFDIAFIKSFNFLYAVE